jgi:hypothetical protein
MNPSWRKPFGMLLILALISAWAVLIVTITGRYTMHPLAEGLVYIVAGLAWLWLFPMRRLLRWMELGRWRD